MRSSRTRLLFPAAGILIIIVFSTLFYLDITRRVSGSGLEKVGELTFKRRMAQRKYGAQVVWEDVKQHTPVYNYDSIRTADMSEAVIRLKDGTEIALAENSLITVVMSEEDVKIDFARGAIKANREEGGKTAGKLDITSGGARVLLGKGSANLYKDADSALNLTLNRGSAVIASGDKRNTIDANQKAVVADDGVRVYKLNLKLSAPEHNAYLFSKGAQTRLDFSWEPVKGAGNIFLEIARDNSFQEIRMRRAAPGTAASLPLPEGVYYWRLKAQNQATGKVDFSEVRRFSIVRDTPLRLVSPHQGALVRYSSRLPIIAFKWERSEIESLYELTIARDAEMKNEVRSARLPENELSVDDLPAGSYFWRVRRTIRVGGREHEIASAVRRFTVEKTDAVPPPEPLYPSENASLNRLAIEKGGITFTWRKSPEIAACTVTVARDKEFSKGVLTATATGSFLRLSPSLDEGTYFWQARGVLADRTLTSPSPPVSFQVVEMRTIALVRPEDGASIASADSDAGRAVEFVWGRVDLKGAMRLEIAREADFSQIYKTLPVEGTSASVPGIEPGRYHWRVRLLDGSGAELMKSGVFSFSAQERLAMPVALAPAAGTVVDMSGREALSLRWKPVEGATMYRIGIFRMQKGAQLNVVQKETRGTAVEIRELSRLDVGGFFWTLQALETGKGERVLRKSPVLKIPFEISLGSGGEKTKIVSPKVFYIE